MRWCCGSELTVMTDSDWAGDAQRRKSMSGGVLLHGSAMISHWSKTQSNVSLSSGEAELNGAVKGISELLGVLGLVIELCDPPHSLTVQTDASACLGMLLRRGAGRVKHLSTKQL